MSPSCSSGWKNCLVWCFLLLFLSLPLILLKLWKTFVLISAKVLRPQLKPFKTRDVMTVADRIYSKPLINIGFVLKLQRRLDIKEFRSHFYKILLEPSDKTGKRVNKNLLRFYKKFWGYAFKHDIKLREVDLEDLIYESSLRNGETFSDFVNRFFYFPYQEGKPLWNVAVLHGIDPAAGRNHEGSVLLFRLHHSMGDGYSLIFLFEQLAGKLGQETKVPQIFQETIWDKMSLFIKTPLTMYEFAQKIKKVPNSLSMSGSNTEINYAFLTLDLDSVKRIRRKTSAHVSSILLTLLGSVIRTILIEQKTSDSDLPEYICMGHSLPWPTHPRDKMCNEWSVGLFKIPIKNPNVMERLEEAENDYVNFHNQGINKMVKQALLPVVSCLPVSVLQKSSAADTKMATSWSTIVAGNDYQLIENPMLNIWPFVGITSERMALVTVSLSHSQKMDVSLGVNREFLGERSAVERMTNELFPKELQNMVRLSESLNVMSNPL